MRFPGELEVVLLNSWFALHDTPVFRWIEVDLRDEFVFGSIKSLIRFNIVYEGNFKGSKRFGNKVKVSKTCKVFLASYQSSSSLACQEKFFHFKCRFIITKSSCSDSDFLNAFSFNWASSLVLIHHGIIHEIESLTLDCATKDWFMSAIISSR